MPRFRRIVNLTVVLFTLAASAGLAEERKVIWIGKHLYNNQDYSEQILGELSLVTPFLPDELGIQGPIAELFKDFETKTDAGIDLQSKALKEKYRTDLHSLIVLSGSGVSDPTNIESLVYLGPSTPAFSPDFAKLRLLTIDTNAAAQQYLKLLLLFAVIKSAEEAHADSDQVIRPLCGKALEYVVEAHDAQPKVVERIEADLRNFLN